MKKVLGFMGLALSGFFFLACAAGGPDPQGAEPEVGEAQQTLELDYCDALDGEPCWPKGPAGACDDGSGGIGACFCTGHLVCG